MSDNVIPLFGSHGCCMARHLLGFVCTLKPAHTGKHVAEGPDGEVWARWVTGTGQD